MSPKTTTLTLLLALAVLGTASATLTNPLHLVSLEFLTFSANTTSTLTKKESASSAPTISTSA